ncbi:hypothetical protein [uncultured Clostridium sp.]|uniref:hypothetical protein n=1 Tax=uncultured Clostridium sp. TaxID=59620 RepID=UPI0028F1197A|nr:hypothetical protein [uncultured Clostridium sp.]
MNFEKEYYKDFEKEDCYRNFESFRSLQDKCKEYLNYHIMITMTDESMLDGIIVKVDVDGISVLIGEDVIEKEDTEKCSQERQFHGHRRPMRFRRFRHRSFPFSALAAISLLQYPYIIQPPYPYYPY